MKKSFYLFLFLSILGFGMGNYKDSKMEKIADAGNGNNFYIDNIMEAKKFSEKNYGELFIPLQKTLKFKLNLIQPK